MKGYTIKGGHKRPTKAGAGMTKKGVAKYRRENPGSKLKTAVTGKVKPGSKAAKRRKSFCARSAGQINFILFKIFNGIGNNCYRRYVKLLHKSQGRI